MKVFQNPYLQIYQTIYQASNDAVHLSALNASLDPEPGKIIHQYNSLRIVLPLADTLFQKLWHDWQRLNWIEDFTSNSRYKPWWRWEGKRPHPRILCDLNRPTIHLSQRRKQNGGWNEDLWKFVGKHSAFISIYLSNFMKKRLILQMRNGSSADNRKFLILMN